MQESLDLLKTQKEIGTRNQKLRYVLTIPGRCPGMNEYAACGLKRKLQIKKAAKLQAIVAIDDLGLLQQATDDTTLTPTT